ncbi:hypothetical protein GCM10027162_45760 [Streptomyces incanus]
MVSALAGMVTAGVAPLTPVAGTALTFLVDRQAMVVPIGTTARYWCWPAGQVEADGFGAEGEFGAVAGREEGGEGGAARPPARRSGPRILLPVSGAWGVSTEASAPRAMCRVRVSGGGRQAPSVAAGRLPAGHGGGR